VLNDPSPKEKPKSDSFSEPEHVVGEAEATSCLNSVARCNGIELGEGCCSSLIVRSVIYSFISFFGISMCGGFLTLTLTPQASQHGAAFSDAGSNDAGNEGADIGGEDRGTGDFNASGTVGGGSGTSGAGGNNRSHGGSNGGSGGNDVLTKAFKESGNDGGNTGGGGATCAGRAISCTSWAREEAMQVCLLSCLGVEAMPDCFCACP